VITLPEDASSPKEIQNPRALVIEPYSLRAGTACYHPIHPDSII